MYRSGRSKSPDQKRQSNRVSEPSTSSEDERSRRSGRDYNATELKRAYERATCSQDLHKKDKFIQLLDEFIDEDDDEDVQKTKDQCPHRRTSNQVSTHNLVTDFVDWATSAKDDSQYSIVPFRAQNRERRSSRDVIDAGRARPSSRNRQNNEQDTSAILAEIVEQYTNAPPVTRGDIRPAYRKAKELICDLLEQIEPNSQASQMAVGGASGWLAGVLFMKIGKMAAFVIGAGLLAMQFAHYHQYVQIDWGRIHRDLSSRGRQFVRRSRTREVNALNIVDFMERNKNISMGFIGGFLIGLAMT